MKTAVYARVSTDRQAVEMQLAELRTYAAKRGWSVVDEYVDQGCSGSNTKRPAFTQMMADAKRRRFDLLLVWKLDRLGRSLKDLITTLDELSALGVDFVSLNDQMDTSTPAGKLVFQVIGAVAEFERDIIKERVKAGLANARRKGKRLGRPPIPPVVFEQARRLRSQGLSYREIGRRLDLNESTIRKRLKA